MFVNRSGVGGKILIMDYAAGVVPGAAVYWEGWGTSEMLDGWLDTSAPALWNMWRIDVNDRQLVGDWKGVGHDQLMFINRDGSGGKIMIVDYAGPTPAVPYWESWGDSPLLDGWLDHGDLQIVGDFMGAHHAQLMYVNRGGSDGKVIIVDYAGATPGVRYGESWGQSSTLGGWIDDGDLQVVGDFMGLGRDQLLCVNRQNNGDGKLIILDYATGVPGGSARYLEGWPQPSVLDPFLGAGDGYAVGDFTGAGHDQLQSWNLDDPGAGNAESCPSDQAQLADTHTCVKATPWDGAALTDGQYLALQGTAARDYYDGGYDDYQFQAAWVQLTSHQASGQPVYDYFDLTSLALTSRAIFQARVYPAVAGDVYGQSPTLPLTDGRYQKIVLQGSNGLYNADTGSSILATWTTNAAAAAQPGNLLLLDRTLPPPLTQLFYTGVTAAYAGTPAAYWRRSWTFKQGQGNEAGMTFCAVDLVSTDAIHNTASTEPALYLITRMH